MPYKVRSYATAEVQITKFAELSKEIEKLGKTKPVPKDKIKELNAVQTKTGQTISKLLVTLIKEVHEDFIRHAAVIDVKLGAAELLRKDVASRADQFTKDPTPEAFLAMTRSKPAEAVAGFASDAQEEADDFGKSWFKLRGHNVVADGGKDLTPFVKSFMSKRSALMGENKSIPAKLKKFDLIIEDIELSLNDMRAEFASGKAEAKDAEDGIQETSKFLADWRDDVKEMVRKGINQLTNAASLLDGKELDRVSYSTATSSLKDVHATLGGIKDTTKLRSKKLAQTSKMFKSITNKGDAMLVAAADSIADAKAETDKMTKALMAAMNKATVAQKKLPKEDED